MSSVESIIAEHIDLTLEEIAEALLRSANVKDTLPTDLNDVVRYLNLKLRTFQSIDELEFLPKAIGPKDIRAVLSYNHNLIATNERLSYNQKVFSIFHEVGHYVLPEHIDEFYLCDREALSYQANSRFEGEASKFASEMIFQGQLFSNDQQFYHLECKSIIKVANTYGSSIEAAARRFVEKNSNDCALVVYDKASTPIEDPENDGFLGFETQYTIVSKSFREKFFTRIRPGIVPNESTVIEAYRLLDPNKTIKEEVAIKVIGNGEFFFNSELFTNGYKVFRLLYPAHSN